MLVNVNVKNLALIDAEEVYFDEGLNILTGETGAGKSIIIGSILIALGGKLPKDIVRDDKKEALVELVFAIQNDDTIKRLNDMGIFLDDEKQLIVSRKIVNGRSIIKVNGESYTTANLKRITELLIDIHGQHDHQSLLKQNKQLEIIDGYAGEKLLKLKENYKSKHKLFNEYKKKYDDYNIDEESRKREISFCAFEIDEIDKANLKENEYEEIEELFKKLSSAEKITSSLSEIYGLIGNDGYDSALDKIGSAYRISQQIGEYDCELADLSKGLSELENICQDMSRNVKKYADHMSFDEEEVRITEQRMDELNKLRQKYDNDKHEGDVVSRILEYRDRQAEKLEDLENYEKIKEDVKTRLVETENELNDICREITRKRKETAEKLEKDIVNVLTNLNFLEVKFRINFKKLEHYTDTGTDEIEFLISTNPGEKLRPLSKIASGGELSRIMLGIKTIMASKDQIETLIFDEIDTGISGITAGLVAKRMKELSNNHQIICITHLPQIASKADTHFLIKKSVKDNQTNTNIYKLSEENSIYELARMLSDGDITKAVLDNAKEMKK